MPVMKQLNVGGTTYDTVGEASVTQVLSSGTKIATVSIDGTSTDLYAPSGGSSARSRSARISSPRIQRRAQSPRRTRQSPRRNCPSRADATPR